MPEQTNPTLKLHVKMQFFIILLTVIVGFLMAGIILNTAKSTVDFNKAQLKGYLKTIETISEHFEKGPLNEDLVSKAKLDLKKLQAAVRETVELGAIQEARAKKNLTYIIPVLIFIFSFLVMFYLHRIIGPIFRLQKTVSLMAEGKDIGQIKIRTDDALQPLANSLEKLRLYLLDIKRKKKNTLEKAEFIIAELEKLTATKCESQGSNIAKLLLELKNELKPLNDTEKENIL